MRNRELKRYGLRAGAYDGANRRRFVLFRQDSTNPKIEWRREFDTKRERDECARQIIRKA